MAIMYFIATNDDVGSPKPDDPSYEELSCANEELLLDFKRLVIKILNMKNKNLKLKKEIEKYLKRKYNVNFENFCKNKGYKYNF